MGFDHKVNSGWWSPRLHQHVNIVRYGHFGQPLLLFPTAGGDCEEAERWHLIGALWPLIEAGRLKVYSVDSIAGMALVNQTGSPQHRMWVQNEFHHFVRHEVVPAIHMDSGQQDIWTAGASIGAFHALAVLCRFPDVFAKAVPMSGTFDLRRFFHAPAHAFNDHFWSSSPVHFVGALGGHHLDVLRTRYVHFISGEGKAESIGHSFEMAAVLGRMGVPNYVESWGPDWPHDWHTWRAMLPGVLARWTGHDTE